MGVAGVDEVQHVHQSQLLNKHAVSRQIMIQEKGHFFYIYAAYRSHNFDVHSNRFNGFIRGKGEKREGDEKGR